LANPAEHTHCILHQPSKKLLLLQISAFSTLLLFKCQNITVNRYYKRLLSINYFLHIIVYLNNIKQVKTIKKAFLFAVLHHGSIGKCTVFLESAGDGVN